MTTAKVAGLAQRSADCHIAAMDSADAPKIVETPCIKVCVVDGASRLCVGCHRSLPEIARWQRFTDAERAAIMAELPGRRSLIDPTKLPPGR